MLRALAAEGALAMCEIVALELLYSARNLGDYEQRHTDLRSLPWLPDLIVAATAAEHEATVLHYDLIARVTGQPTRWIIPRGTGHGQR